jgi:hypothetical protein
MTYRERLVLANTLLRAVPSSLYHTLALTTAIPPRMNASSFRIRFQEDAPPHDPSLPCILTSRGCNKTRLIPMC